MHELLHLDHQATILLVLPGACMNSSLDVTDVNQAQKGLENTLSPLIQ